MKKIFICFLTVVMALNTAFLQNILIEDLDPYSSQREGDFVLLTPTGKLVNDFKHAISLGSPSEGLISARDNGGARKLGYIDAQTGAWVIKPKFDLKEIFPQNEFYEGLAVVIKNGKNEEDAPEYGAIDKTGKLVIPFSKGELRSFSEGLAAKEDPKKENKYGFVDKSGKWVIPAQWTIADDFKEGMAAVSLESLDADAKYGFIDKTGKLVIKYQWADAKNFQDGLAAVVLAGDNSKYGFIDKSGEMVIQQQFSSVETSFSQGLAVVRVNNDKEKTEYYHLIDKSGKVLTQGAHYLNLHSFGEDLFVVEVNGGKDKEEGNMGFIDKSGKLVLSTQFKTPRMSEQGFSEGLAPVNKGYIDTKGKLVVSFPDAGELELMTGFKNGVASLAIWNKNEEKPKYRMALIDKTGKILWQSAEKEREACFPAGVYVSMANGSRKKIEDIQAGDKVLDLNKTPSVVEAVEVHSGNFTIGAMQFNVPENVDFASLTKNNNTVLLEATLNHPLSIRGKKVPFSDVKTGDKVLQIIDNQIVETSVRQINLNAKKVNKVYNLRTKGKGYFVNGYGVFTK